MAETADHHGWTDQKLENIVGNLLRTGVSLAAVVVFSVVIAILGLQMLYKGLTGGI